jgi:ABC-type phosphate/phosphonate transport system substrate-binding protein
MYDFPWLARANDALWAGVARHLRAAGLERVPDHLDRTRPREAVLRDPDLLLGHTCGYPLMTALDGVVRPVATPRYALPGCDGAWHRSLVVVREDAPYERLDQLRGRRAALNGFDSNTGMNLLRAAVAPLAGGRPFFGDLLVTGAHLESLAAVRSGRADVAAIDCVTHGLAARHRPDLVAGTRVLAWTEATPSLPLVTRAAAPEAHVAALRSALDAAAADPDLAEARAALALEGFEVLPLSAYGRVLELERAAAEAGYPTLA